MKSVVRMLMGMVCGFLLVIPLNVLGMYGWFRYRYLYAMSTRRLFIHLKYSNKLFMRMYYYVIVASMKSIAAALNGDYDAMLILFLVS